MVGKEDLNDIRLDLLKTARGCLARGTTLSSSGVQFSDGLEFTKLIKSKLQKDISTEWKIPEWHHLHHPLILTEQ